MTFTRKVALIALLLPATLIAQGAGQPTQAQLKARAELARQRALQQQASQTKAPATAPATKTATPQTKAGTPATTATVPQTKTTPAPQTKSATPPAPQTKTAAAPPVPVPQTKAAVPQTKTATVPPPAPQTKAAPAGSAIAAGPQGGAARVQPKPPAEVTFNREVFAYTKANRRDPFTTMITSSDLRPQITDLKLVTVIFSSVRSSSVAIMRDLTTNEQYRVRVGQTLGRMRVAQIQQRAVVFSIEEFGYNRQEVVSMDDSTRARTP